MPMTMTPEITQLIWAIALTFAQMLVAATGSVTQVGLMPLIGNREGMPPRTGWAGRAERAHRNMLENLVLFAGLVLAAGIAGVSNETTILGAQLFFWGRLAYAVIYVIGLPWIRTGAWAVSIIGLVLIFLQLV